MRDPLRYYSQLALLVAKESTCRDKQVGAVLVDAENKLVSCGYNGAPHNVYDCVSASCCYKKVHGECIATHAEVNAVLQAGGRAKGGTLYVTLEPCLECIKICINAGIKHIFFLNNNGKSEEYKDICWDIVYHSDLHIAQLDERVWKNA